MLILWFKLLLDIAPINPAMTAPVDPPSGYTSLDQMIFIGDTVSFKQDIFPIFQAKCSIKGCHGKDGMPGLVRYTRHSNIQPNAKRIKKSIHSRVAPMPPKDANLKLTEEEVAILTKWIDAGAPDN